MNAERVFRAAGHQFAQEDHLAVDLAHAHIIVFYAREETLHLVELMIVGCEERACLRLSVLVQMLHDGPRNGYAIVGRGATAQLIEEHERARRHIVQDVGGLGHLNHERRLAQREVVGRSHTGEDLVDHAHMCALCRHEAAHLCHERDEGCLAKQGRLARHVGTGDDHDLLAVAVEEDVVGHIALAHRQLRLYDGVTALLYVEHNIVGHLGAHIAVLVGSLGERQQAVETCRHRGVDLYVGNIGLHVGNKLAEETCLERQDLLVGTHDLLLILLQLLGDVTLSLGERLLAHPLWRHLVLIGVAHLKIISKHVVVAHLERGNARALRLALLDLQQVVASVARDLPQLVKLGREAVGNDAALGHELWRVGLQLLLYALSESLTQVYLLAHVLQRLVLGVLASRLDLHESL